MTEEGIKRKLAAILSADVEGYSRLMSQNEVSTIRTLTTYREAMTTLIQQYKGRVVDSPGDNLLAEFPSVLDAVNCAVEIQRELAERNAEIPSTRKMEFRIGINLGDVVEEEGRIYGDGVNIAARIESLAEAGGICISGKVYEEVENKLDLEFEFQGEQEVKNIAKPVRIYRVLSFPGAAAHRVVKAKTATERKWRKVALIMAVVLVLCVGAVLIWQFYLRRPSIEPASLEKMAFPLPDKPSIAVLPFVNMSGDPEQEYIADGITENITTAISKIPEMFVIARTSAMAYKGKPVNVKQVSEELGVRYVLEGSVQKEGDRVRITAQLVDAIKGHHLWAERYDRDVKGFFKLLDEMTREIGTALQVKLTWGDYARHSSSSANFEAWGLFNKAYGLYMRAVTERKREDNIKARELFEKAFKADPEFAGASLLVAWTHLSDVWYGWSKSPQKSIERAIELAKKARTIGVSSARHHALWSVIYTTKGQNERAIKEAEKAIVKDPNWPIGYISLFMPLLNLGRFEEAIPIIKTVIRFHGSYFPANFLQRQAIAYSMAGHYEKAISTYKEYFDRCKAESCLRIGHLGLAMSYVWLGQEEKARNHASEVLKIDPKFSLERYAKRFTWRNQADIDRVIDALRKAGLPDKPPLPLPNKPSIAVLPFTNMSGDPKQDFIGEGISESIITALSKTPQLFVIARNSSFSYKGKSVKVQHIGRDLGVRYVLEGSIQKSGDRLRITAQLIDAKTGNHLWADKYDRNMKDIFALQDEVTMKILTSLQVKLTEGEQAHVYAKSTDNIEAYLKLVKGKAYAEQWNKEDNIRARQILEEVITLDSKCAPAYGLLAFTYLMDIWFGGKSPYESIKKARELTEKALTLDDSLDIVHSLLGWHYIVMEGNRDKGFAALKRAITLAPNSAFAYMLYGIFLYPSGKVEKSIRILKKGIRLNPSPPGWYFFHLGRAYYRSGQFEKAVGAFKKGITFSPDNIFAYMGLIL